MKNSIKNAREISYEFLKYWTIDKTKSIIFEEYVPVRYKNISYKWFKTRKEAFGNCKQDGYVKIFNNEGEFNL